MVYNKVYFFISLQHKDNLNVNYKLLFKHNINLNLLNGQTIMSSKLYWSKNKKFEHKSVYSCNMVSKSLKRVIKQYWAKDQCFCDDHKKWCCKSDQSLK